MTEINGIAHTMLTVSNFEVCREFYLKILAFMGLKPVIEFEGFLYFAGGRTAFGIQAADERFAGERFEQKRVGLHHLCFRAREREDVDGTTGTDYRIQFSVKANWSLRQLYDGN